MNSTTKRDVKVHILFPFTNTTGSGGHNFLHSLRDELKRSAYWEENAKKADIIIFNSHHEISNVIDLKRKYPEKTFIHRIDGPMTLYNNSKDKRDHIVALVSRYIADGIICQSKWSKEKLFELGFLDHDKKITVIHNAPKKDLFKKSLNHSTTKIKIISSGWSVNPNKGAKDIEWLDQNLDFNKYELIYIGKPITRLKNARQTGFLSQEELARELSMAHVYFFPSRFEACSNALLEGLHSGLIPIAKKASSNIELIQDNSLLYDKPEDILTMLESISLQNFSYKHNLPDLYQVMESYISFSKTVKNKRALTPSEYIHLKLNYIFFKLEEKIKGKLRSLGF